MKNLARDRGIYTPLDELLALAPVRILRALVHFDWLAGDELGEVIELYGVLRSDALNHHLMRMARRGLLDRKPAPRAYAAARTFAYRINARGRAELNAVVARSAPERELGPLDDIEAAGGDPPWKRALRERMRRQGAVAIATAQAARMAKKRRAA